MILDLPEPKEVLDEKEWHLFWCIKPRIINNKLVWLSRAQRRLIKIVERYDGATGDTYRKRIYEYDLPVVYF